jgi:hypothetical protein
VHLAARNVVLPDLLQLSGELLPWVSSAEHLSHTFHQDCTLDLDAKRKRDSFIDKSCDIREGFNFAHPEQIMKAAQFYVSDAYGFMLYDLASQSSKSYLKSCNTFVKLAWEVPHDTYTNLVENSLAKNISTPDMLSSF